MSLLQAGQVCKSWRNASKQPLSCQVIDIVDTKFNDAVFWKFAKERGLNEKNLIKKLIVEGNINVFTLLRLIGKKGKSSITHIKVYIQLFFLIANML